MKEDREKKRRAAAGATIGIELEEKLEVPERKCSKMWIRRSLEFTGELHIPFHLEVKYLNYISLETNCEMKMLILQKVGSCLSPFFAVWRHTQYLPLSSTTAMFDFDVCLSFF